MASRRRLFIAGCCLLAISILLFFLSFVLPWLGMPLGPWIAWGVLLIVVSAALCFILDFVRNMPGWRKARGLGILALAISPILYLAFVSRDPSKHMELLPYASFIITVMVALIAAFSAEAANKSAQL